jgi:hypothetical protein
MATVLAILLETAATSVRRSKGIPSLIYPPTRLEKPGGKYPSEKSLFIDGFAPPSPPMATVFALVLETAFTSVRRSARRVAPFPLICPPILPRDPAPRTSLHGTTGMSVRLAHMLWCSHTARHCPEPPALSL